MYEQIAYSAIGALMGAFMTYVVAKRMLNTDKILEIFDEILTEIKDDTEMQKKVFAVGILLGQGIKTGVGLNPKSGKFKFEDLLTQGAAMFLQQYLNKSQQQPSEVNPFA
jgi:hypothetical protein